MEMLVKDFPQSKLAEMAGMIVNGVKQGRRLHGGKFDLGDVWSRRSVVLSDSDSIAARELSPERNEKFLYVIAYHPDSIDENKLLFEMARYNFTNFMVRNFDIEIVDTDGPTHMRVSGFLSYDEALQYARSLHQQEHIMELLGLNRNNPADSVASARVIIISEPNLELLGRQFSYDDYAEFYEKNFVPLEIDKRPLLSEPAEIGYEREPELNVPSSEEEPSSEEGEGYRADEPDNANVVDEGTFVEPENAQPENTNVVDEGTFVEPENAQPENTNVVDDGTIVEPENAQPENTNVVDEGTIVEPENAQPENTNVVDEGTFVVDEGNGGTETTEDDGTNIVVDDDAENNNAGNNDDVFIFDDDENGNTNTEDSDVIITDDSDEKEDATELEVEYFELDGF